MDCDYSKLFYAKRKCQEMELYQQYHSGLGTGTISSRWTPVGAGSAGTLIPADAGNVDVKHLDVGDMSDVSDDEKDLNSADAEGVWSPDIEQSFQEALAIYPPCGRRKIILSEEGKMYGRNELIARYIKIRTGKTRTRKQVSSHIQVLARRKLRELQAKMKVDRSIGDVKALQTISSIPSAQLVPQKGYSHHHHLSNPSCFSYSTQFWQPGLTGPSTSQDIKPFGPGCYGPGKAGGAIVPGDSNLPAAHTWEGRSIATHKFRLVEFSAYLELRVEEAYHKHLFVHIGEQPTHAVLEPVDVKEIYDKFPQKTGGLKELYEKGPQNSFFLVKFWADLNTNVQNDTGAFYGVSSHYESNDNIVISCSTKVCSFGKQVVEKVETEYSHLENGRFVYRINRSPMCDYMINFINKLKHLPEKYMMNSVLENFTILQVISNKETQETLLCIAFVFEVSTSEHGAQHHIYRLVQD